MKLLIILGIKKEDALYDLVLVKIIESTLKLQDREALKYINLRKESLPVLGYYKSTLDLIHFKKTFKEDHYGLIDSLKETNIPKEIMVDLLLEKLDHKPSQNIIDEIDEIKKI